MSIPKADMTVTDVKPNHGATILDEVAVGKEHETQSSWLAKQNIDPENRIKLRKLAHMRYQHPDLDALHQFMLDFGMQTVERTDDESWYRGYGVDQYVYYARKGEKKFLGGAFLALSQEEFDKASKLPTAGKVETLDGPGGGSIVTIIDPEGFPFNVIFGQEQASPLSTEHEKMTANYPDEKPRVRKFKRFEDGPAAVHKLGHYGLVTQKFPELLAFYTSTFNVVPSDLLYIEPAPGHRILVTSFMHIDLGDEPTDHHSFFLSASMESTHVHHCSFEVHDFDTQHLGHQWLAKKGYTSVWGVGRHILGSQIFDYWWDITGNMVEHYADGDLVNKDTPIGYFQAGSESLAVWGPEVPATFLA